MILVMNFHGKFARADIEKKRQLQQMNKPLIEAQGTNKATLFTPKKKI